MLWFRQYAEQSGPWRRISTGDRRCGSSEDAVGVSPTRAGWNRGHEAVPNLRLAAYADWCGGQRNGYGWRVSWLRGYVGFLTSRKGEVGTWRRGRRGSASSPVLPSAMSSLAAAIAYGSLSMWAGDPDVLHADLLRWSVTG